MGLGRYLVAAALSTLLATPVVAQTASPSTSTSRPAATAPSTTAPSTTAPSTTAPSTTAPSTASPSRMMPSTTAPSTTSQSRATTGSQEQGGLIDINSASVQELDNLPGVGPARAQAIVANRPYKGKDDLAQRKILPQNVYDGIKDKIVARQGSAKESTGASGSPSGTTKSK